MFAPDAPPCPASDLGRSLSEAIETSRILVVDDNVANVELLREILNHHGYQHIVLETDPRRVEGLCRETAFDLLLLDVRMPHLSGFDLIEITRQIYADQFVPILVLTAQTDLETRRKALQMGANDFLNKPFVAWELLHRIRNALSTRVLYRQVAEQNQDLERRVAERTAALSDALVAAREGERAKLDFLSMMSHELRTPLNAVIGFAEVLSSSGFTPLKMDEVHEYAALIEENGKGLLGLVNKLLEFTRAGTAEIAESDFSLRRLVGDCLDQIGVKAAARQVAASLTPSFEPVVLRGDRRRIKEALLSLLDNAVKFNNPLGTVVVDAACRDLGDGVEGLLVTITDTGVGLPEDHEHRLFTPFVQGDHSLRRLHEGIGLGLPMVRRHIELHGGTVTVGNRPEGGVAVTITLPTTRIVGREHPPLTNSQSDQTPTR